MKTSILLCSMGRPALLSQNIRRLYETTQGHEIELVAVIDRDIESAKIVTEICTELNVPFILQFNPTPRGAITCWNEALRLSTGELLFCSGDDQYYHGGWLDHAKAAHAKLGGTGMVGLDDKLNSSASFSTTNFTDRQFVKDHLGGVIAQPCYEYLCVDMELVERAKRAGKWVWCPEGVVEHLHPSSNKRPIDAIDLAHTDSWTHDNNLYEVRKAANFPNDWTPVI